MLWWKGPWGAPVAEVALTGMEQLESKTQSGIQAESFILLRSPSGFWCDSWSLTSPPPRAGLEGSSANFQVNPRVQPELCCRGDGRHIIGERVNQIFVTSQSRTTASIKGFLWSFCVMDLFYLPVRLGGTPLRSWCYDVTQGVELAIASVGMISGYYGHAIMALLRWCSASRLQKVTHWDSTLPPLFLFLVEKNTQRLRKRNLCWGGIGWSLREKSFQVHPCFISCNRTRTRQVQQQTNNIRP